MRRHVLCSAPASAAATLSSWWRQRWQPAVGQADASTAVASQRASLQRLAHHSSMPPRQGVADATRRAPALCHFGVSKGHKHSVTWEVDVSSHATISSSAACSAVSRILIPACQQVQQIRAALTRAASLRDQEQSKVIGEQCADQLP